jgi:Resolvase, N terminal domain
MRRAIIYLRVSTIEQTTANQERELREIANRMGCEIVKVYKDHGISGTRGRDKRPAFDKLCRDAALREFDMVMAGSACGYQQVKPQTQSLKLRQHGGPAGPQFAGFGRLPVGAARIEDRPFPAPTGPRHDDARRQSDVSDVGRVC